jgi:hypothetical protein
MTSSLPAPASVGFCFGSCAVVSAYAPAPMASSAAEVIQNGDFIGRSPS